MPRLLLARDQRLTASSGVSLSVSLLLSLSLSPNPLRLVAPLSHAASRPHRNSYRCTVGFSDVPFSAWPSIRKHLHSTPVPLLPPARAIDCSICLRGRHHDCTLALRPRLCKRSPYPLAGARKTLRRVAVLTDDTLVGGPVRQHIVPECIVRSIHCPLAGLRSTPRKVAVMAGGKKSGRPACKLIVFNGIVLNTHVLAAAPAASDGVTGPRGSGPSRWDHH